MEPAGAGSRGDRGVMHPRTQADDRHDGGARTSSPCSWSTSQPYRTGRVLALADVSTRWRRRTRGIAAAKGRDRPDVARRQALHDPHHTTAPTAFWMDRVVRRSRACIAQRRGRDAVRETSTGSRASTTTSAMTPPETSADRSPRDGGADADRDRSRAWAATSS